MARPTDCTPEVIAYVVEAHEAGANVRTACNYAGISETSYHHWRARGERGEEPYSEFAAAVKKARGRRAMFYLGVIKDAAEDGDWKAGAWWLERVEGYTKSVRVEQASAPDPTEDLTNAEIEARLRQLQQEREGEE